MTQEKPMRPIDVLWRANPNQTNEVVRVQRDSLIGYLAGTAKLPSDVGGLFNWEWAKDWEDGVNSIRDKYQSDKLLSDRTKAIEMLKTGASFKDVADKYPESALQYGIENALPLGSVFKGIKAAKAFLPYARQLGRFKGGRPELALGVGYLAASPFTGAINSIFQDYKDVKVNDNDRLETNR